MDTYTMQFRTPIFFRGIQSTLRRGTKWSAVNPGDLLALTDLDNKLIDTASVVTTKICHFNRIEENDPAVKMEHDPRCQNLEGLKEAMEEAYPEFKEEDLVTWVVFAVPAVVRG